MRVLPVMFPWLFCISLCYGYRLLGVFPFHAKSHSVMFEHLIKGLIKKGHRMDVISPFSLKETHPNYTNIVKLKPPVQLVNNMTYEFIQNLLGINPSFIIATLAGNDICRYLGKPEIQKLVRNPPNDPPYDAILMEIFGANCFGIIGHLWNVPIIGVSTTTLYPWLHRTVDHPESLAFVPNNCISLTGRMNFWQRVLNVVHTYFNKFVFYYLTTGVQDDIIREHFGPGLPSVRELETKLAMILINSHISLNGIKPTVPAVVDVGGLHVHDEGLTLQPELEKWMNNSKDGFIYFTFGSMVVIESFPQEFLNVLYASLGKLAPVRILMKVPNPDKLPADFPKNIYTYPWMPQIKILQHPNIKAFITHGGLMGTQEAIAYGVPMIGIPLFSDQFMNIDSYVAMNIAVRVDVKGITEEKLDAAINEILWNPIYRENMQNVSRRFFDRPLSSLDTAVYWVEYVIKYGSDALRSPAMDLTWWQLNLIDVFGFLLLCVVIVTIAITYILRFLLQMLNQNNRDSSKKTN